MKNIIIDGKEFDIFEYSNLEDLVDTEFEGKDLSKIEVEDLEDIPDRLYNKTPVPCTLEEALEDTEGFDTIFDWVDYVQDNDEKATLAYIDNFMDWDRDHFEDTYEGYYESEEDFAESFLDGIGWDFDLSSYLDYSSFAGMIWSNYGLDSYTPEALNDYREELGLPPLDKNGNISPRNRKELELSYGFIGDDIKDEEDAVDSKLTPEEEKQAEEEYNNYIDEYSFEIRLARFDNYDEVAEEYIDSYGSMESFIREEGSYIKDYIDIESFARDFFYDYTFVDGYVFNNY